MNTTQRTLGISPISNCSLNEEMRCTFWISKAVAHANYLCLHNVLGSAITTGNSEATNFGHPDIKSEEQLNHVVRHSWEEGRKVKLLSSDYPQRKTTWSIILCNYDTSKGSSCYPKHLPEIRNKIRTKEWEPDMSYAKAGTQRHWLK